MPKTPFFVQFAKFGSSFGRIVSELPAILNLAVSLHRVLGRRASRSPVVGALLDLSPEERCSANVRNFKRRNHACACQASMILCEQQASLRVHDVWRSGRPSLGQDRPVLRADKALQACLESY